MSLHNYISYSKEVEKALAEGEAIVAIETAGTFEAFDYPVNKDVANLVMNRIRQNGAVPAYIAIVNGVIKVGLEPDDVEYLANMDADNASLASMIACNLNQC